MAKPELLALLICDAISVDPNGKFTIYGVFDVIWSQQFPAIHPKLAIVSKCWLPTVGELHVEIDGPDGSSIAKLPPVTPERAGNVQVVYELAGLPLPLAGEYKVRFMGPEGPIGVTTLEARVKE